MSARTESEPISMKTTTVERTSEREFSVTRSFDAPARLVYEAWTKPELLMKWWAPRSMGMTLVSCEADVRVGGTYRFVFGPGTDGMAFHGRYLEVVPHARLVWTNEEGGGGEAPITTMTLKEVGGKTLLVLSERHASKEAVDEAIGFGEGLRETFGQLDELLVDLGAAT